MGTSVNDLRHVLVSILGFELEDGDHVRYVLRVNSKIIARTMFSRSWRGNVQIDDKILSLQAKQMHCSNQTLKKLLRGHARREEYFREILDKGLIDQYDFAILCKKNK